MLTVAPVSFQSRPAFARLELTAAADPLCLGSAPAKPDSAPMQAIFNGTVQEVFISSMTLNGTALKYPVGKPELRLYRVEIPSGGKIPLHTHPAPMLVYVQSVRSGSLLNTHVQPDGTEIKTEFKPGEAFVEGANEPHFVENVGKEQAIIWVTVASVEGMPTTKFIDQ